jgi:hypothetical protein
LLVNLPSPHLGAPACLSTYKVLQAREHAPTLSPFIVFTFGLATESIKEFGVRHIHPISWFFIRIHTFNSRFFGSNFTHPISNFLNSDSIHSIHGFNILIPYIYFLDLFFSNSIHPIFELFFWLHTFNSWIF